MIRGKGGFMKFVELGSIVADTKVGSISGGDDDPVEPKEFLA
jgi:hypothetical protein